MADDTQRDLEKIAQTTVDFAKKIVEIYNDITKATKETNAWADATKAVQSAMEGAAKSKKIIDDIDDKVEANIKEVIRLRNEELPALDAAKTILDTRIAQNDALKASTQALLSISAVGSLDAINAQEKLNDLTMKGQSLQDDLTKNDKRRDDINRKIIPTLQHANTILDRGAYIAHRMMVSEKQREMNARKIAVITEGIIKPLSKESAELSKISNAMFNIGKNAALAMAGDPAQRAKALLEIAKEVGVMAMDRWIELQKASGEFLKNTGLLGTQTDLIDKTARSINTEMQYLGVSLKDAYATAESLYKSFGTTALVTKDMMFSSAKLAANLGLANEDVANFKSTFDSISKSTGNTSDDMIKASTALAKMGGVAPSLVLKDMANASGTTLSFLAKSPIQLAKAAVEARRLGTTIEKIASSARGLLNYEESMRDELTASALIGRSISFQNARQLAFEGKIVESRKAALEQIKLAGDFTKLTVYQQEALAKAAGMTVEEITKQQNQEKMLAALKNSTNADDRKAAAEYEKMMQSIAANENNAKNDLVARGREMANQQLRQTELNKLTNAFSAIWTSITDALLPIANIIMPIIVGAVKVLAFAFEILAPPLGFIVSAFTLLAGLGEIIAAIPAILGVIGTALSIAFSPIGLAVAAFAGLYYLIKNFGPQIYEYLKEPFEQAWDWIKGIFIGNSPSELGLGIVDGIKSIGSMLIDALTFPFRTAMNFISGIFGGDGTLGTSIVDGIKSIGSTLIDILLAPYKAAWNLIKKIPFVGSLFGNEDSTATIQSEIQKTITASVEIVNMDELSDNIASLSAAIDRLTSATSVGSVVSTLTGNNSNSGIEEKLDKLTSLLTSGAVRTFLNGKDVSGMLANSNGR